jgi:hypothetical protein
LPVEQMPTQRLRIEPQVVEPASMTPIGQERTPQVPDDDWEAPAEAQDDVRTPFSSEPWERWPWDDADSTKPAPVAETPTAMSGARPVEPQLRIAMPDEPSVSELGSPFGGGQPGPSYDGQARVPAFGAGPPAPESGSGSDDDSTRPVFDDARPVFDDARPVSGPAGPAIDPESTMRVSPDPSLTEDFAVTTGSLPSLAPADVAEKAPKSASWAAGFTAANQTETNLLLAAEDNNTDQFLSTLLLARVVVPVPKGTSPNMLPADPAFPWQLDEIDGEPFIPVFTSPERLAEHMHERLGEEISSISLRFVQLISAWPDEEISFAVNPGSPVGATLPGSQIVALASWAAEVGLRDEPAGEIVLAAKPPVTEQSSITGRSQKERATVMQKAISAAQVPYYLERGYDRVSGFVHRVTEVDHLTAPRQLVPALGLDYSGSPFSVEDAEIHVLRWVAHRNDLYRIPYGGPHEDAMRAMQGWVIERSPFRGNGFAPGDGAVIAEFKVDSIRLPHGAQMWRMDKDGNETFIATFDADGPAWLGVGDGGS